MGNQCLASSPLEHYQRYFDKVNSSELKDYWTTIQVYKIKKLYDSLATQHPQYNKFTHLELQKFLSLFPQLEKYPERQKLRIFELFNFDGSGQVDWNNFYSMISICYFGSEQTLATIMFLIFDESLSKQLSKIEIELMCNYNENSIVTREQSGDQMPIYDSTQIIELILKDRTSLSIETWLQIYKKYFTMSKFRRIFNIFIEEKLEKDLIRHFNQYNNLYVENQERYVSYLIDFKWFEAWKLYVKRQYGYTLTSNHKKPMTFKSKKTIKSSSNVNGQKIVSNPLTLRELKFDDVKTAKSTKKIVQDEQVPQQIKNFDFIHNNIGDKPKQMNNKVLEGDYEQVLKLDIIENRDYVFISEKVWKILKKIYQGYPQFRRTGFDFIELYPKILRILPFRNGSIKYNEENIKEVSAYYAIQDVLEVIMTKQQIQNKKYFFKTIGMKKWQQLTDLSLALAEISTEVIIYISSVALNEAEAFARKHKRIAKDITEINVGDQVRFEHPVLGIQQKMVFLGKNVEGKFILHIPNESYIYDICIIESDLIKKAKYSPTQQGALQELRVKKKQDLGLIGISNTKSLGYVNAMIMHFYYNFGFKQQLLLASADQEQPISLLKTLIKIYRDLTNKKQVNTKLISQTIEQILPDFIQFSADMCDDFFHEMLRIISVQSKNMGLKDYTEAYTIKSNRVFTCKKCKNVTNEESERFTLSLPLNKNQEKYYEIIFVPFCQNLNGGQMKRFGFKLKPGAKLKQYKDAFETVAGLKQQNKTYLLMQVYSNNIVKNYSTAKNDATLEELLLRDTDTIVAFELQLDFSDFVARHYSQTMDFQNSEVKIDQFVDCKNSTRGWIFGKVCEKDFTPYGHRTIIRVIHKFSKGEQWEISYDVDEESVANFPTKSYLNGQQYHLRLQQRYFNEASNDMEICNMPLVVVLANWMRWRQFYYMVYLQMRRFINEQCFQDEFLQEHEEENQFQMYSCKSIGAKSKKKTQKMKLNKFKQFIYGPKFPYKLKFIDYSGRCAICFKFLKSQVFQGENDTYCQGCELSTSEPIAWQIKVADVMVCVDWKKLDYFKKDIVKDHSSYANLLSQRKNDVETLDNCLKMVTQGHVQMMEQICCNSLIETTVKQTIVQKPQYLTMYLERIIEENGFIKIINKHVKFNESIKINEQTYWLYGVISIEGGSNKINKYRKFIMISSDEWLQYDSNIVRCVKRSYLQKVCALNLFYKKKQKQIV